MRVAVAGGTGLVGEYVMSALSSAGHRPVALARATGVDVISGTGLDGALDGIEAVVDATNVTTMKKRASVEFFETGTRNLLAAGERAGVSHHVVLSIAGSDRVDFGYYQGKRKQEDVARNGVIPWSVLRATQFHEFAAQLLQRSRGPIAIVPKMLVQPIAAREVGEALARLATGPAVGLAPELGGPQDEQLSDMARAILKARGARRPLLALRIPGATGRAMAGGALRAQGSGPTGRQTFAQWLDSADSAQMIGDRRG